MLLSVAAALESMNAHRTAVMTVPAAYESGRPRRAGTNVLSRLDDSVCVLEVAGLLLFGGEMIARSTSAARLSRINLAFTALWPMLLRQREAASSDIV